MSFKVDNPKFAPVGVADTYADAYGKTHLVDVAVKKQLLAMMATSGFGNAPLPSVRVFRQGEGGANSPLRRRRVWLDADV